MRVLVTGANGVSAQHLIKLLRNTPGMELYLTDLRIEDSANCLPTNLSVFSSACKLIRKVGPHQIYNFAGTFTNNYETDYEANVLLTKNLLDAVLNTAIKCRVLLIGSAAEYGEISREDNPVKETQELKPVSVYGLTKTYQTEMMKFYCRTSEMDIVMARPFNLLGKGVSNRLFIGNLYEQIDNYRKGNIDRIVLGNLSCKRDYIDVTEAAKHYHTIMNHGRSSSVYNVGSGKSVKISDLLETVLRENLLDMTIVEERIIKEKDKSDIEEIYADITKLEDLHREARMRQHREKT